jgi:4-carboxymuconolactone decarboxylase
LSTADRLPLPETLTADQQSAVDAITAGPRGELVGPFVPLLRSPELMTRLQEVGAYLRFGSAVPLHLRELVILIVARDWNQDFEWGYHAPLARSAGIDDAVVDAVGHGDDVTGPEDVQAVWRLVRELLDTREVSDATFAQTRDVVGDAGVVDLIAVTGYYTTLAMTMNAARTPVPAHYERLPNTRSHA